MPRPAVRTGSHRNSPIIIDDNDDPQQNLEEDTSDADTIRISTPEYEQWADDYCSAAWPSVFLTDSVPPPITFLKDCNCSQFDCTLMSQAPTPLAEGEFNEDVNFRNGAWIIACLYRRGTLTKTVLFQASRRFSFRADFRCLRCRPRLSYPFFT